MLDDKLSEEAIGFISAFEISRSSSEQLEAVQGSAIS